MSEPEVIPPAPEKKKSKRGAPKKITVDVAKHIFLMMAHGLSDEKIAEILGISQDTIFRAKQSKEFCGALKEGKDLADEAVIRSMYLRAIGYSHPETKVFCQDGNIVTHEVVKHYPPDTAAGAFILINRKRGEWRKDIPSDDGRNGTQPPMIRLLEKVSGKEAAVIKQTGRGIDVLLGKDFVTKVQSAKANGNGHAQE